MSIAGITRSLSFLGCRQRDDTFLSLYQQRQRNFVEDGSGSSIEFLEVIVIGDSHW